MPQWQVQAAWAACIDSKNKFWELPIGSSQFLYNEKPSPVGEGGRRSLTDEEFFCICNTSSTADALPSMFALQTRQSLATCSPAGEGFGAFENS